MRYASHIRQEWHQHPCAISLGIFRCYSHLLRICWTYYGIHLLPRTITQQLRRFLHILSHIIRMHLDCLSSGLHLIDSNQRTCIIVIEAVHVLVPLQRIRLQRQHHGQSYHTTILLHDGSIHFNGSSIHHYRIYLLPLLTFILWQYRFFFLFDNDWFCFCRCLHRYLRYCCCRRRVCQLHLQSLCRNQNHLIIAQTCGLQMRIGLQDFLLTHTKILANTIQSYTAFHRIAIIHLPIHCIQRVGQYCLSR